MVIKMIENNNEKYIELMIRKLESGEELNVFQERKLKKMHHYYSDRKTELELLLYENKNHRDNFEEQLNDLLNEGA